MADAQEDPVSSPDTTTDADPMVGRTVGIVGAVGVGVGAIVGGGILALAGAAFQVTGPSAIVAFAINGGIALITALSFAEMSTAFPQSGGAYLFAKKVLSVQSAFAVGWVLWFAYIVAAVLYALGFAEYGSTMLFEIWAALGGDPPAWLKGRTMALILAMGATGVYVTGLLRRASGGSQWASWAKVVVFVALIIAGFIALPFAPEGTVGRGLSPFFSDGSIGLVQAMGFTFIALQGFEVIAAIGGEIKHPRRNIPRAMFASLGIGLTIYLPLLFLVSTVGIQGDGTITEMSKAEPGTVMARAVGNYLSLPGYWLVLVAAVLSMLSALQANLLAASRISLAMARERTLPRVLAEMHPTRGTPVMAVGATALAVGAVILMIPDIAQAGAAASLIFLVSFALAHVMAYLARKRVGAKPDAFNTPWFPAVPFIGAASCGGLALFQALAVPTAGAIVLIWLGLGVILYFALFRDRAAVVDALAVAHDPDLARLRGHNPLVLVSVANPLNAAPLVALGNAMASPEVGRVLLLTVVRHQPNSEVEVTAALSQAHQVLHSALAESVSSGHTPEALLTFSDNPWDEILRIARTRRCESLALGLPNVGGQQSVDALEALLNDVDCDAAVLWSPPGCRLLSLRRILVPIGGKGGQDELRARILGSLYRTAPREVTYVQVVPTALAESRRKSMLDALRGISEEECPSRPEVEIIVSDDSVAAIAERAGQADLLLLGLARAQGRRAFGQIGLAIVQASPCATLMISRAPAIMDVAAAPLAMFGRKR